MDKLYITPKPLGIFDHRAGLTIWKGFDNRRYLFIVSSNSYKDREAETIATKALKSYVDKAWAVEGKSLPDNPLLFWHGGDPIGDIVWTDLKGPFLIEVARERKNATVRLSRTHITTIQRVWDMLETSKERWGASQGFRHFPSDKDKELTYHRIFKFETSVLPLENAANQYTFAGVIDMKSRNQVLDDLLKIPQMGDKLTKGIQAVKRELDKRGLEHKELQTTVTKGKLDEALTIIEAAFAKLGGTVPDGFAAATLQNLVGAMAMGGDTEPDPNDPNEANEDPATETMDTSAPAYGGHTDPAMMNKQLDLIDKLITSQQALVESDQNMSTTVKAIGEAILVIAEQTQPLLTSMKSITDRMDAIEKRLSGAPKRASVDASTVVDDKDLTAKAKAQADKLEELFPGSGVMMKPKSGNGNGG